MHQPNGRYKQVSFYNTMTTLLNARNLSKFYGPHAALKNIDITLQRGEILGFLGPNGAGKSTTMKLLSGNLAPHTGHIEIKGIDLLRHPQQAKQHLGYLPENPPLLRELTVKEFLTFCAGLHHIPGKHQTAAVSSVLARCSLESVSRRLIGQLSKGYQQRVGIAQAIIHAPAVVILDEPTSGLDPMQIHEIRSLIRQVATEHSVILSTHTLSEVETLCDRVHIINRGQSVFSDSLPKLNAQRGLASLLVKFVAPPTEQALLAITGITQVDKLKENFFRCHYALQQNPTQLLLLEAIAQNWQLAQLTPENATLESVFMQLVKADPEMTH